MRLGFVICFFCMGSSIYAQPPSDTTPINKIQILASHNSYKKKPHPKLLRFLKKFEDKLGAQNNPDYIDYGHVPFPEQFDTYGIRGIELDVNYDPLGGNYKRRRANLFVFGQRQRLKGGLLKKSGFKLLHIADVDFESNYLTFKSALKDLSYWSKSHPGHLPIYVNIEAKGSHPADESKSLQRLGFANCIPFDTVAYLALEEEIKEVLTPGQIYVPADFKDTCQSLRSRINSMGWPLLEEVRGKIVFVLEGSNQHLYKSLPNPSMFYYGAEEDENVVFLLRNNSVGNEQKIRALVSEYIVRTRADAGTIESRNNDKTTWESALMSGAQIISTDYYKSDLRWSNYQVGFENSLYRLLDE